MPSENIKLSPEALEHWTSLFLSTGIRVRLSREINDDDSNPHNWQMHTDQHDFNNPIEVINFGSAHSKRDIWRIVDTVNPEMPHNEKYVLVNQLRQELCAKQIRNLEGSLYNAVASPLKRACSNLADDKKSLRNSLISGTICLAAFSTATYLNTGERADKKQLKATESLQAALRDQVPEKCKEIVADQLESKLESSIAAAQKGGDTSFIFNNGAYQESYTNCVATQLDKAAQAQAPSLEPETLSGMSVLFALCGMAVCLTAIRHKSIKSISKSIQDLQMADKLRNRILDNKRDELLRLKVAAPAV